MKKPHQIESQRDGRRDQRGRLSGLKSERINSDAEPWGAKPPIMAMICSFWTVAGTDQYTVLAGLQRRGFRLELSADDESVVRVTSPGGSTLDHPSLDELRHLLRGISIRCLTQQCDQPT